MKSDEELREILAVIGMPMSELARRSGLTPAHVNKIVDGTVALSAYAADAIGEVLADHLKNPGSTVRLSPVSNKLDSESEMAVRLGHVEKTLRAHGLHAPGCAYDSGFRCGCWLTEDT